MRLFWHLYLMQKTPENKANLRIVPLMNQTGLAMIPFNFHLKKKKKKALISCIKFPPWQSLKCQYLLLPPRSIKLSQHSPFDKTEPGLLCQHHVVRAGNSNHSRDNKMSDETQALKPTVPFSLEALEMQQVCSGSVSNSQINLHQTK